MGRPKITGEEKCPYPSCERQGRIVIKTSRGRKNARYIQRYWFHHNDTSIPDHYIDSIVKNRELQYPFNEMFRFIGEMAEQADKLQFRLGKLDKIVSTFPMTEEERRHLNSVINSFWNHKLKPLFKIQELARIVILSILNGKDIPKNVQKSLNDLVTIWTNQEQLLQKRYQNTNRSIVKDAIKSLEADPLNNELKRLFEKYEFPRRRKRSAERNKALSEWPLHTERPYEL